MNLVHSFAAIRVAAIPRTLRLASALPMVFISLAAPPPTHAASGELWENTTVMESEAGSHSLGTQRECHPVNWAANEEPGFETEGECRHRDIKKTADGYTWELRCDDGRQGRATLRRLGRDQVDTDLSMETPQGRFALHIKSRRVGTCANPGEDG